jgi:hypothetical protein
MLERSGKVRLIALSTRQAGLQTSKYWQYTIVLWVASVLAGAAWSFAIEPLEKAPQEHGRAQAFKKQTPAESVPKPTFPVSERNDGPYANSNEHPYQKGRADQPE